MLRPPVITACCPREASSFHLAQQMAFPEHTVVMLAASSQQRSRSRIVFRAACAAACLLAAVALLSSTSSSSAVNAVLESPADAQLPVYHDVPGDVINSIEDRLDRLQSSDRVLKNKLKRLEAKFDDFQPIPGPRGLPGADGALFIL
jgi:hypothetical protein